jgi:predicted N-formylglutamate amidohydrolase
VQDEKLIDASEGPVSTVSRADGVSDIVLVCEHAAKRMP